MAIEDAGRPAEIRRRLEAAFEVRELTVDDESHKHVGHPGARDGRGHFRVRLVSRDMAGLSRIARHRAVHRALGDLMETDIHALSLDLLSPDEVRDENTDPNPRS